MTSLYAAHPQLFSGVPHVKSLSAIQQQQHPASVFNAPIATPSAAYAPTLAAIVAMGHDVGTIDAVVDARPQWQQRGLALE